MSTLPSKCAVNIVTRRKANGLAVPVRAGKWANVHAGSGQASDTDQSSAHSAHRGVCTPDPSIVPIDIGRPTQEDTVMQVTLTKDLESFIAHKVRAGGYADSSEVVREALRRFRTQDDPAEADSRELAEFLLPAVRGPHRPLTTKHFDQLRVRARRKPACP